MRWPDPAQLITLAHVALQRLFAGCVPNQEYFSKRESLLMEVGDKTGKPMPWVKVISAQSEDPLGATVTLSALLASNAKISERIVNDSLLRRFLKLIGDNGPQPRLIQLFSSVCICAGQPITGNQEMVLRMIWLDAAAKKGSLLSLVEKPKDSVSVQRFGVVKGPSRDVTGRENFMDSKQPSGDFLGKKELASSGSDFKPVFCSGRATRSGSKEATTCSGTGPPWGFRGCARRRTTVAPSKSARRRRTASRRCPWSGCATSSSRTGCASP